MRFLCSLLAAVGFVGLTGAANAATFNYSSFSVLNPVEVAISDPSLRIFERGDAGQITLDGTNLTTFCFDIADALQANGAFTLSGTVGGPIGAAVNALLSHVLPTLTSNTDASAALQLAIWSTEYGTGRSGVSFAAPPAVLSLAASYTAAVNSGAWKADPAQQVNLLTQPGNQSQIYVARVSEPGTIGVLAIGAIGALYRRYCRAKGQATSESEVL